MHQHPFFQRPRHHNCSRVLGPSHSGDAPTRGGQGVPRISLSCSELGVFSRSRRIRSDSRCFAPNQHRSFYGGVYPNFHFLYLRLPLPGDSREVPRFESRTTHVCPRRLTGGQAYPRVAVRLPLDSCGTVRHRGFPSATNNYPLTILGSIGQASAIIEQMRPLDANNNFIAISVA